MAKTTKPKQTDPIMPQTCDRCFGKGETFEPSPDSKGWDSVELLPCPKCRGTGKGPVLH